MSRLRSFLFVVVHRDGTRRDAVFYAQTARQATQYARAWAQKLGHARVELEDESDERQQLRKFVESAS